MPTFSHGKNSSIFLGGYDLSTSLRSAGINRSLDTGETTAFKSTNKTYVIGTTGATADIEGMFAYDDTAKEIGEILEDYAALETAIPFTISYGASPTRGDVVQGGVGYLSQISYSGSSTDIVGMSASIQMSDNAGRSLALQTPATAISCTGVTQAGTSVSYTPLLIGDTDGAGPDIANTDFPAGGISVFHVLENSVNATTTIVLQSQDASAGYVDIGTAQSFTSATVGYAFESTSDPVDDDIRWNIVTTGTGTLKLLAYFIPTVSI